MTTTPYELIQTPDGVTAQVHVRGPAVLGARIHMQQHGHGLSDIGVVIGVHIGAMFLPSLVTGVLVDRLGRLPMAIAAGVTLLAAGVTAALAPTHHLGLLLLALALLGLGWNFGLISGTALIVDATPPSTRAKTQGSVDLLVALAGASGGVLSGIVVAATGYSTLALAGGFLSLLLIPVVACRAADQDQFSPRACWWRDRVDGSRPACARPPETML